MELTPFQAAAIGLVVSLLVHFADKEAPLARKLAAIAVLCAAFLRTFFLSALMGPDEDAADKKAARDGAKAALKAKNDAILEKYAKQRADGTYKAPETAHTSNLDGYWELVKEGTKEGADEE